MNQIPKSKDDSVGSTELPVANKNDVTIAETIGLYFDRIKNASELSQSEQK